ncbi:MAG: PAS domain S-box protein [Ignavibacteriaceae bacterium]|nr:PAS domain S-box protein [Ignavibacteriaceae bacterium]
MKILIVEDDFGITDLVADSLNEIGLETSIAFSGTSAIEQIKTEKFDLILLDYSLPDMTGRDLINQLKRNKITVPPFIVSTGQGDERIAVEMMKLGAHDYLTKDAAFFTRISDVVSRAINDFKIEDKLIATEEALRVSEENFKILAENIPGVIYLCKNDSQWSMIYLSDKVEQLTGYPKEDFLNNKIGFSELYHPEDKEGVYKSVEEAFLKNESFTIEYRIIDRNNVCKWIEEVGVGVVRGGKIEMIEGVLSDITERRNIQTTLRNSERNYRGLFNSIQQAIYIQNPEGVFLDVNDGALRMYGYLREEMIGKTPEFVSAPDKNNFEEVIDKIRKAFQGEPQEFEFWGKRKNGEIFPKHVNVYKASYHDEDVIIAIAEDITSRKANEAALIESEERFRNLFNTMPNGFYRSTPEGYFIDANPAFIKMLGYDSLEELRTIHIPTDIYVKAEERDDVIAKNPEFISNIESYRLKTKDGRIIWIEDNARYIRDENDNIIYHEGICRDITERMENEFEIKRYTTELEKLNEELLYSKSLIEENLDARNLLVEELEKLNMEKDKFFSIIAHDLRSPFHAFLALTSMMAENISDFSIDELGKISKEMHSKANNLFNLLRNLLEWARIQRGSIVFTPSKIVLAKVLQNIIEAVEDNAKLKEITINKVISDNVVISADEKMLNSLFQNLLSNAIKFTNRGGEVFVKLATLENSVLIEIRDSGIGMSPELLNKLFKLEEKVGHEGTAGEESTGLGLLLCKDFADFHRGKIWVESEVEKGSTFFVELPRNVD